MHHPRYDPLVELRRRALRAVGCAARLPSASALALHWRLRADVLRLAAELAGAPAGGTRAGLPMPPPDPPSGALPGASAGALPLTPSHDVTAAGAGPDAASRPRGRLGRPASPPPVTPAPLTPEDVAHAMRPQRLAEAARLRRVAWACDTSARRLERLPDRHVGWLVRHLQTGGSLPVCGPCFLLMAAELAVWRAAHAPRGAPRSLPPR